MKVTARYGWTEVPQAIKLGTMIQASRLYARRETLFGPLSLKQVDDVEYRWKGLPEGLDGDVAAAVAPFVKWWGAV